jgi:hypothetical protein
MDDRVAAVSAAGHESETLAMRTESSRLAIVGEAARFD